MSQSPSAFALQRTSPVCGIKPFLLLWVLLSAKVGNPLTKTGIIELANEMITHTLQYKKLSEFKMK
jgi:hypothetical protein